ncbi:MAG: MATE family efflux transporter [Lachnospiraceae bacterium]|jgi:putative MATE family efflux protein|nr:MATE family efflux transporter [Lachnospiraceae bacterium]MEE3461613.1 MATE family efflux transporter [Lachnospiraceae bacterium]
MKKEIDMTHGPVAGKILKFAMQVAMLGILQQLFNAADVAVVGRCIHPQEKATAAMAAVGANSSIVGLFVNLFVGISLGTNVIIANAAGHKDKKTVRKTVHTSVLLGIIIGLFAAVIGEILSHPIIDSISVPEEAYDMALSYLRIYVAGIPFIVLYNFESAIFRGIGDTLTPLITLIISGIINVAGNFILVAGFSMDVDGVAIATVFSNAVSAAMLMIALIRTKTSVRLYLKFLAIDKAVTKKILIIGVPAGVQAAVYSFANIIVQAAINSLGTVIMAASSAAFNIEIMVYYIINSFSQACTTFVGQNNGAGDLKRCHKVFIICFIENTVLTALAVCITLYFGRSLLGLFNTDPAVISNGMIRLKYIYFAYIFSVNLEVAAGYMRGFGISLMPAVMTLAGVVVIRLFMIFALFPTHHTFPFIMSVYPVSLGATAVLMYIGLAVTRPSAGRKNDL